MVFQSAERSKTHEKAREQLDQQLKDSLLEAQNLRYELEVRNVDLLVRKCGCCVGGCVIWPQTVGTGLKLRVFVGCRRRKRRSKQRGR
jgi:hypothetical protein